MFFFVSRYGFQNRSACTSRIYKHLRFKLYFLNTIHQFVEPPPRTNHEVQCRKVIHKFIKQLASKLKLIVKRRKKIYGTKEYNLQASCTCINRNNCTFRELLFEYGNCKAPAPAHCDPLTQSKATINPSLLFVIKVAPKRLRV